MEEPMKAVQNLHDQCRRLLWMAYSKASTTVEVQYAQLVSRFALTCLQEEENLSLAAQNAALQQQLQDLEAAKAAAAAAHAAGGSPSTPASSREWISGVQERAEEALQRAADTRRLSGVFQVRKEQQCI
jgi:hypothetical protein